MSSQGNIDLESTEGLVELGKLKMRLTRNYSRISNTPGDILPAVVPVESGDWPITPKFDFSEDTFKRAFRYYHMPSHVRYEGKIFLPTEKFGYARKTGKLSFEYQAKHTERRPPRNTGESSGGEWWQSGGTPPEYGEEEEEGQTLRDLQWHNISEEDPETGERTVEMESRIWVSFDRRDVRED
jgi:hypothetical protein